jgi:predicted protein tyrosine phosphatase
MLRQLRMYLREVLRKLLRERKYLDFASAGKAHVAQTAVEAEQCHLASMLTYTRPHWLAKS